MEVRTTNKDLAGWAALAAALLIAGTFTVGTILDRPANNTLGIGLVASLLSFAAASFGIRAYERVHQVSAAPSVTTKQD